MGLSGRRGRERRESRGVSDSKTGGMLSKRKAALGVAEYGEGSRGKKSGNTNR